MFLRQSVFLVQCPLLYVQREQPERLTASRRCQKLWSHAASRASLTSRAIILSFCAWQAVIRIDGFAHRRDISAARLRVTDRQRRTTEGNVFLLRGAARLTRTECRLLMSASLTSGREREREKRPSNRKLNHRGRKKKKVSPLSLVVHHVHSYWKKSTVFVRFWSIRNWERSLLPEEITLKFSFWHHTTSHFFFVFLSSPTSVYDDNLSVDAVTWARVFTSSSFILSSLAGPSGALCSVSCLFRRTACRTSLKPRRRNPAGARCAHGSFT